MSACPLPQYPALTALLLAFAMLFGCSPREPAAAQNRASAETPPPSSAGQTANAKPKAAELPDRAAIRTSSDAGPLDAGVAEARADTGSALAPEPRESEEPSLFAPDGGPLPQTEERPSSTSARFRGRMQRLFRAIQNDDPESAHSTFFPLSAYEQVKDVAKPERDYRYRLLKAFDRTIHEYHRALGNDPERASLVDVDVPEQQARWMKPGSEGNKLGYYRVLHSTIRYTIPPNRTRELELTSLISWRGEWYVVHLSGFK